MEMMEEKLNTYFLGSRIVRLLLTFGKICFLIKMISLPTSDLESRKIRQNLMYFE